MNFIENKHKNSIYAQKEQQMNLTNRHIARENLISGHKHIFVSSME